MAQYNHLPIFQTVYKLTLEIYKASHQFSRGHKYTLGQKLKNISSDMLDLIVLANNSKDKTLTLKNIKVKLEQMRIGLRLAYDLKVLGNKRYEFFCEEMEGISKQLSGWLDWSLNSVKGDL